jgi:hypothetical protein
VAEKAIAGENAIALVALQRKKKTNNDGARGNCARWAQ